MLPEKKMYIYDAQELGGSPKLSKKKHSKIISDIKTLVKSKELLSRQTFQPLQPKTSSFRVVEGFLWYFHVIRQKSKFFIH